MKGERMKFLSMMTMILVGASGLAFGAVDPSSVKMKIYGVSVSTSADCSNPVSIFSSDTGTEFDMVKNPTLGEGDVADGTYECVMITMSDLVKATPATSDGVNCVADTEISGYVCQSSESYNLLSGSEFGATTSCTSGEDKVTLYLHTGTTRTNGGNAFLRPTSTTDTTHGFQLGSSWVVSGSSTGTFVADFRGKMVSAGGECGLNPPLFSFR